MLSIEVEGLPIELGATFIHGTTNNVIYDLAKRYKLISETSPAECETFSSISAVMSNGDPIPDDTIMKCWTMLADDEYIDLQIDKYKDLYDYYATEYFKLMKGDCSSMGLLNIPAYSNSIFECFLKFKSVYEGLEDCKNVNLDDDFVSLPGVQEVRFDKGHSYTSLFSKLVEDLPKDTILYSREVVGINTESDPILIKCRNGDQFEADHVIITVSLGVLETMLR